MINEAILVGRVGKKDTKTMKNGSEITVLSLATTSKHKDASGEKQEFTTWHHINCFSKLAEIASKYVHVGDVVYIRGTIYNRKIETGERAGQHIYSVTAQDIKFLPGGTSRSSEHKPIEKKAAVSNHSYEEFDDQIPF